jgi:DNA-binding transcriptional regulator LsrR (DeoR family)
MFDQKQPKDRLNLLADIAEMYFCEGKNQSEIAEIVGVTRSNISRMLTEARSSGIVKIRIDRPLKQDLALSEKLINRFDLTNARAINIYQSSQRLTLLGKAAGDELISHLKPNIIVGTSWGTAISTTVEEIAPNAQISGIRVVQLLGALGSRIDQYDAHAIVRRLADKLDAEGIYLNAPFLVEDQNVAKSLLSNRSIAETLELGRHADIALLGVGSSDPNHSSYFLADYVTESEMREIQNAGAIGDVCGRFYDITGNMAAYAFQERLIGISAEDLINIPVRIGVAGGPEKVEPIIGALRSKLVNVLITDTNTATSVLANSN